MPQTGLIGACLVVAILNVLPSAVGIPLNGDVHLMYVLLTLFAGVVAYWRLSHPPR